MKTRGSKIQGNTLTYIELKKSARKWKQHGLAACFELWNLTRILRRLKIWGSKRHLRRNCLKNYTNNTEIEMWGGGGVSNSLRISSASSFLGKDDKRPFLFISQEAPVKSIAHPPVSLHSSNSSSAGSVAAVTRTALPPQQQQQLAASRPHRRQKRQTSRDPLEDVLRSSGSDHWSRRQIAHGSAIHNGSLV